MVRTEEIIASKPLSIPPSFQTISSVPQSSGEVIDVLSDGSVMLAAKTIYKEEETSNEGLLRFCSQAATKFINVQECIGFDAKASPKYLRPVFSYSSNSLAMLVNMQKSSKKPLTEALINKICTDVVEGGRSLQRAGLWHPYISQNSIFYLDDDAFIAENQRLSGLTQEEQSKSRVALINNNVVQLGYLLLQLCTLENEEEMMKDKTSLKENTRKGIKTVHSRYSQPLGMKIETLIKGKWRAQLLTFENLHLLGLDGAGSSSKKEVANNELGFVDKIANFFGAEKYREDEAANKKTVPLGYNQYLNAPRKFDKEKHVLSHMVADGEVVNYDVDMLQANQSKISSVPQAQDQYEFRNDITIVSHEPSKKSKPRDSHLKPSATRISRIFKPTAAESSIMDVSRGPVRGTMNALNLQKQDSVVQHVEISRFNDSYVHNDVSRVDPRNTIMMDDYEDNGLMQPSIVGLDAVERRERHMFPAGFRNDITMEHDGLEEVAEKELMKQEQKKGHFIGRTMREILKGETGDYSVLGAGEQARGSKEEGVDMDNSRQYQGNQWFSSQRTQSVPVKSGGRKLSEQVFEDISKTRKNNVDEQYPNGAVTSLSSRKERNVNIFGSDAEMEQGFANISRIHEHNISQGSIAGRIVEDRQRNSSVSARPAGVRIVMAPPLMNQPRPIQIDMQNALQHPIPLQMPVQRMVTMPANIMRTQPPLMPRQQMMSHTVPVQYPMQFHPSNRVSHGVQPVIPIPVIFKDQPQPQQPTNYNQTERSLSPSRKPKLMMPGSPPPASLLSRRPISPPQMSRDSITEPQPVIPPRVSRPSNSVSRRILSSLDD